MTSEPSKHVLVFVGGVVVEDDMDRLAGRHGVLDRVEETDELRMPVALHALSEHGAVERVEGSKFRFQLSEGFVL